MRLADLPLIFLDLQTTGARPNTSQILEMAWCENMGGKVSAHLIEQPVGAEIPRRILQLTGISSSDMERAIPLSDALDLLNTSVTGAEERPAVCVIHYAQFEKPFLIDAFQRVGQNMPFSILCTYEIAKRLMPNLPTRGIRGLAGYFGYVVEDLKRANCHVEATQKIWVGLVTELAQAGIETLEQLQEWLSEKPTKKRTKYEYPLTKEKRLSLPNQPGIYRMLSRTNEVLYVGKATSLKDRVNSYFRGQKNRDPKKLEMLTQVWDIKVTPTATPLEAALLETDEIKRFNPRYNINLKMGRRELVFFSHDFRSVSKIQDEHHGIGPFSNIFVFDSLLKLSQSLGTSPAQLDETLFFETYTSDILEQGFEIFCRRHSLKPEVFSSMRSILAVGLRWYRNYLKNRNDAEVEVGTEGEADSPLLEVGPKEIADKFERHFTRGGYSYWRARQLTKLLNSDIEFQIYQASHPHQLKVRGGQVVSTDEASSTAIHSKAGWSSLAIETYDRMSVLTSELSKIRSQHGYVRIEHNEGL